jgi:HK97 family phage major capsid protein
MNLKELKEKFKKLLLDARALASKAEEENRDFSAEERTQVENLLKEAGELKKQIKEKEDDLALMQQIMQMGAGIDLEESGAPSSTPGLPGKTRRLSIGQQFVKSDTFISWLKSIAPSGKISEQAKGLISPPVEFKSLFKALVVGADDESAGAFVQIDYSGIYEPLGRYPLNIMGLVSRRTTTSDLVEFVRQTVKVQEAAPVPEANVTEYSGATGEESGEKPEGEMAFEKVTTPVKTIAVWIPATKRALSDAAQIRGLIDQELRDDLMEELEDQIVNGDGTGENFTGLVNTSGLLTQAWNTDLLTTIRKARTALRVLGRSNPTAIVMHPNDAERLDLLKDSSGRYYFGGPINGDTSRVWRVPVVESETQVEGSGIMGDWRKAVVWDREQASIQVSDSHADFFIRNMVAILAELRAAFGVIRPSAFIEVELESGS